MSEETHVKLVVADPSALGLFGLAMITLVASAYKFGALSGLSLVIPWAIFLGGLAQVVACLNDIKHNNVFGATAFGGFAFFWLAMGMSWMCQLGVFGPELQLASDPKAFGFAYLGYLIFSLVMTIGAVETNKMLFIIFIFIDLLFIGLMFSTFGILEHEMHLLAAYSEASISIIGFYGFAGNVLNKHFGYEFCPLGKPFGIFKKK
jgi:hypothetical protein